MSDRGLILLSRVIAGATLACGVASVVIAQASGVGGLTTADTLQAWSGTVILPVVTLVAIPKVPRNGSVWALTIVGLALGLEALGSTVAEAVAGISWEAVQDGLVTTAPADLPIAAAIGYMLSQTVWIVSTPLLATLVLLLFPDGRYPEPRRRWRWVGVLTVTVITVGVLAGVALYWPTNATPYAEIAEGVSIASVANGIAAAFFIPLAVTSMIGYVIKWRRSTGEERIQYRWVGFAFFSFSVWLMITILIPIPSIGFVDDVVSWTLIVFIPVAYTVAILKYRLYGIDVVISKTVTYGVLLGFITGVYALLVVGVGSLVDAGDGSNLVLSVVAVAIVAVAFEPLRRRVQHWANVVVYGKRATPYEVLASATARLSGSQDPDAALGEVTRLVVDGTGAESVVLWLLVGDHMYPRTATPTDAVDGLGSVAYGLHGRDEIPGDAVVMVKHRGEILGALSVTKGRGDAVTGADRKVLDDVAAGAGALLRNIGLNAELAERAEQLRVSRRRLVAAQDAERHRLERDLHDGAQQQVVALKVKLGIARSLAEREGADQVATMVESLADTTQQAVDQMREVAHGIYPPLLEAEGLEAALTAAKRRVPIPVEIVATGLGRYDRPIEESLYFAVLGVVTASVDVGATRAIITLKASNDTIGFTIDVDTRPTDLTPIEDRIDAHDGTLTLDTTQRGFTATGDLPLAAGSLEYA